jgi:Zn finger protein HypA/HybF involved in hydrogenase expression
MSLCVNVQAQMNVLVERLFERQRRHNLAERVSRELRGRDRYVECRRCGTTLSSASAACPNCDSDRTVTYEVD